MANVRATQPHTLSRTDAKARMQGFSDMMGKYGARLDWAGDRASIKGIGVSGTVHITDAAVDVNLVLGFVARAAGVDPVRLKGSIERRLAAAFEPDAE